MGVASKHLIFGCQKIESRGDRIADDTPVAADVSVATKLQQLVNQRFRSVLRDAEVAAEGQRTFSSVEDGLLFFERL